LQLIHFERPDLLNDDTRHELDLILARRLMGVGDNIPWLTIPQALKEFETVKADADGTLLERLLEHEQYLHRRHKQTLAHLQ